MSQDITPKIKKELMVDQIPIKSKEELDENIQALKVIIEETNNEAVKKEMEGNIDELINCYQQSQE